MTKDEIYERLAQVYLGKREEIQQSKSPKKPSIDATLLLNVIAIGIVLTSVFYGLTAFLSHKNPSSQKSVIFALNNSPIRIKYDVNEPYPQVSKFSIEIPRLNAARYDNLNFSIRGIEEGFPGTVKVTLRNKKNETAHYFVSDVEFKWQKVSIPFSKFRGITDWTNLTDISFVFEAWNTDKKKGVVLIDDLCFSKSVQTYAKK